MCFINIQERNTKKDRIIKTEKKVYKTTFEYSLSFLIRRLIKLGIDIYKNSNEDNIKDRIISFSLSDKPKIKMDTNAISIILYT
jgi:hypothetical protein